MLGPEFKPDNIGSTDSKSETKFSLTSNPHASLT